MLRNYWKAKIRLNRQAEKLRLITSISAARFPPPAARKRQATCAFAGSDLPTVVLNYQLTHYNINGFYPANIAVEHLAQSQEAVGLKTVLLRYEEMKQLDQRVKKFEKNSKLLQTMHDYHHVRPIVIGENIKRELLLNWMN